MNNDLSATNTYTQYPNIIPENPIIAVTEIVTLGIIGCVLIITSAKYNRDIELKYKDFSLNIHSAVPVPA